MCFPFWRFFETEWRDHVSCGVLAYTPGFVQVRSTVSSGRDVGFGYHGLWWPSQAL